MRMTEIEATEAKLKCLKMVDGTGLKWWEVVKFEGETPTGRLGFTRPTDSYSFALGVVEGKPVWPGDTLYTQDGYFFLPAAGLPLPSGLSWAPPKPKTVMVEIAVEDARDYVESVDVFRKVVRPSAARIAEVFRKALEAQ